MQIITENAMEKLWEVSGCQQSLSWYGVQQCLHFPRCPMLMKLLDPPLAKHRPAAEGLILEVKHHYSTGQ